MVGRAPAWTELRMVGKGKSVVELPCLDSPEQLLQVQQGPLALVDRRRAAVPM
jgi:hypothetical protein